MLNSGTRLETGRRSAAGVLFRPARPLGLAFPSAQGPLGVVIEAGPFDAEVAAIASEANIEVLDAEPQLAAHLPPALVDPVAGRVDLLDDLEFLAVEHVLLLVLIFLLPSFSSDGVPVVVLQAALGDVNPGPPVWQALASMLALNLFQHTTPMCPSLWSCTTPSIHNLREGTKRCASKVKPSEAHGVFVNRVQQGGGLVRRGGG